MQEVRGTVKGIYLSRTQQRKQMLFCSLSQTLGTPAGPLALLICNSVAFLMHCSDLAGNLGFMFLKDCFRGYCMKYF